MIEKALLFGEAKSLVGVITRPENAPSSARPGVIILNAGVIHRVGPNRMHVRLARELARHGFLSMRFDFSGLGDSAPRADSAAFAQATVKETRQAMEVLASTADVYSFVLVGICSGADHALRAAGHDERVVGAVLIEPYSVPAPSFLWYSYRHKVLSPRSWWRLLSGRSEVLGTIKERRTEMRAQEAAPPTVETIVPEPEELVRQVRGLLDRGTELCFVYSAESPAYFNYRSLLQRGLREHIAAGRVCLRVLKQTDHVFTPLAAQESLVTGIRDWAVGVAERRTSGVRGG
ncbi:MAG TPA: hypothetical protein VKI41_07060 [Vicinamibacteria bacterium]|nr:hypothetical protein [Vicinamibacteria bacterium]